MVMTLPRSATPRPYLTLGRRIAELRARLREYGPKGMSQRELARQVGISEGYVPTIEGGLARPTPEILKRIADVLRVRYSELSVIAGYSDAESTGAVITVDPDKATVLQRLNHQFNRSQLEHFESVWRMFTLGQEPPEHEPDTPTDDPDTGTQPGD